MDDNFKYFVAGFVTGEGSFFITAYSGTWQVVCGFAVKVRADDYQLLRQVWQTLDFPGNLHPGEFPNPQR